MAKAIGAKVALDGEKDFRKAVAEMNRGIVTLGTELRKTSSEYLGNEKSMQSYNSQTKVLQKTVEEYKNKLVVQEEALVNSVRQYGAASKQSDYWRQSINRTETEINKLNSQIETNNKVVTDNRSKANDLTNQIKDLASEYVEVVKQEGKNSESAKALQGRISALTVEQNKLVDDVNKSDKAFNEATKGLKEYDTGAKEAGESTLKLGDLIKANLISEAIIGGIGALKSAVMTISGTFKELVIDGGFNRALNVEKASFKLQSLGHDAASVDAIMKDALASVKGTAYGLDEAGQVAASAVAAGIQPGKDLEKALTLVGDAAAVADVSMSEMGAIFNKVAAGGKMTTQEMNQLTDRGIPMIQLLGDTMGASADEVRELVKAGQIGFPEFQNAIEKGMGGAALTMGQTFGGAKANLLAAFSRMGAQVMTPFIKNLTPAMTLATKIIDDIAAGSTDNISSMVDELSVMLSQVATDLVTNLAPIIENIVNVAVTLVPALAGTISSMLPTLVPVAVSLITTLLNGILAMLPSIVTTGVQLITTLATTIVSMLPEIITVGINLIVELINGIAQMLPELIPVAVEAVLNIVDTLLDNIDLIIDTGVNLIIALAEGLINAIPKLVEKAPVIIVKLVNAIISLIPKLISSGIRLVVEIGTGLIKGIPQMIRSVPTLINNLVSAFMNFKWWDIGVDIVKGIGNGLGSMGGWLWDAAVGVAKSAFNGIKSFFGIKSPSRLMRDQIGKNLALGLGIGFDNEMDSVSEQMINAVPTDFESSYGSTYSSNQYNPMHELIEINKQILQKNSNLMLDGDTLVGGTGDRYDMFMSKKFALAERGRG